MSFEDVDLWRMPQDDDAQMNQIESKTRWREQLADTEVRATTTELWTRGEEESCSQSPNGQSFVFPVQSASCSMLDAKKIGRAQLEVLPLGLESSTSKDGHQIASERAR